MEAGTSPINAPHPDGPPPPDEPVQDPADFFGSDDDPDVTGESLLEVAGEEPVETEALPPEPKSEPPRMGDVPARTAPEAVPEPEPQSGRAAPAEEPAAAPQDPPPPDEAPTRTPRGSNKQRPYMVLREVRAEKALLTALLNEQEEGGEPRTIYLELEPKFQGRLPKQIGHDVFKKHHKRLGQPLEIVVIAMSAFNRMKLQIKPRQVEEIAID